ncbi:hypothetical protein DFH27DRAFT_528637 [Peziza echinospora]|nr:hypothetical protein DFH27DRAFT_528637 [Peziza echinospora]
MGAQIATDLTSWESGNTSNGHHWNFRNRTLPFDDHGPKSALHSGVFADDTASRHNNDSSTSAKVNFDSAFGTTSYGHQRSLAFAPALIQPKAIDNDELIGNEDGMEAADRYRVPENIPSSFSNFVFKPPTSPLVYASNTDTIDGGSVSPSTTDPRWNRPSYQKNPTSHGMAPTHQQSQNSVVGSVYTRRSLSYKRRSVPDGQMENAPIRNPRRMSFGAGIGSDLPFGSFVGSYEESILNGRMSTTPSKPLTFVAKIGVLGMGKCKPALRCPSHITIPFPAYFYSVGDYDSPSPYVGQIDFDSVVERSRKRLPFGGYRIPQQGQLQIVIKNPNKTAVKLFLVPYDLCDMEPGTKTFLRQKAYASGNAILEEIMPLSDDSKLRIRPQESLRYLIHLHICCPSRGRFYLYRNIRVVFANRVPDGKEKLRNEILVPDPRFSSWRPGKDSISGSGSVGSHGRQATRSGVYEEPSERAIGRRGKLVDKPPPIPAVPLKYIDWQRPREETSLEAPISKHLILDTDTSYGKIPARLYPSSQKSEGHGLLARHLKGLDVDGQS